jgi:hypothetical protein
VDVQNAFFYSAIQKQRYLFGKSPLALYRTTILTQEKVPGTRWATTEDMKAILDLPPDHFAACSFLRQSLALSLIHEHALFSGPSKDNLAADLTARSDIFTLLAARDPDACATALREAAKIMSTNSVYATQATELLVNISARLLLDNGVDIEVRDAAQEVLVNLLSQGGGEKVKKIVLTSLKQSYLPSSATTPLFGDKRLVLQGALLSFRAQDGLQSDGELTKDFELWVSQVRRALQDSNVSNIKTWNQGVSTDSLLAIRHQICCGDSNTAA